MFVNTIPSRDGYSAFVTPPTTPKKKRSYVQFAQPQNDSDDEMLGSPLLKPHPQEKLKKVEEKKPSKDKAKPQT